MTGPVCPDCNGTGWLARHYCVCHCRAGDFAWAKWEGMTIEEYDALAAERLAISSRRTRTGGLGLRSDGEA